MPRSRTVEDLDPAVALRQGMFDPATVLVLWCLRRGFFPLLWLGLIVATTSGGIDELARAGGTSDFLLGFDSIGDFLAALLSPLVVIILAFGLRLAVAGLAFASAYPLTRWNQASDYAHGRRQRSRTRLWFDRLVPHSGVSSSPMDLGGVTGRHRAARPPGAPIGPLRSHPAMGRLRALRCLLLRRLRHGWGLRNDRPGAVGRLVLSSVAWRRMIDRVIPSLPVHFTGRAQPTRRRFRMEAPRGI